MDFDFDSDIDNGTDWLKKIAMGIVFTVSAWTTFEFFQTFAGGLFGSAGNFSALFAGVIGLLFCEGAVLAWSRIRSKGCNTENQITWSNVGFWGALVLSVAATALYLSLTNELARALLDTQVTYYVQIAAVTLMVLALSGHMILFSLYGYYSAENEEARNRTRLSAYKNKGQFAIQSSTVKAVTARKVGEVQRMIPDAAKLRGGREAQEYISAVTDIPVMSNGRPPVPSGSRGPGPSPNGRPKPGGPPRPGPKDGPQRP